MLLEYGDIKVIIGVNRKRNNAGARGAHLRNDGTVLNVYGYDSQGRFKTLKVGRLHGFFLKIFITNVSRLVACKRCGEKYKIIAPKSVLKAFICERCRTN